MLTKYFPRQHHGITDTARDYLDSARDQAADYYDSARHYVADIDDTEFSRGLGWASLAIGLIEMLAPSQVESLLGLEHNPQCQGVLRTLGLREVCHGVALLTDNDDAEKQKVGAWSRVAGDVLDSALLGAAATRTKKPFSFATVTAMVLGIGLLDLMCAKRLSRHA